MRWIMMDGTSSAWSPPHCFPSRATLCLQWATQTIRVRFACTRHINMPRCLDFYILTLYSFHFAFANIWWFVRPLLRIFILLVKPFPHTSLYRFINRKKVLKKGKQIQDQLENNIFAFDTAFAFTSDAWRKSGKWPPLLKNLENMFTCVKHYNNRYVPHIFRF